MPKTTLQGRLPHRLRSLATLIGTTADVLARRAIGRPLVPEWNIGFEIGTLFVRRQFNRAFAMADIAEARAWFDSLYMVVEPQLPVDVRPAGPHEPAGDWFVPHGPRSALTLLYFHGGGYAYYAAVSRHFIAMLAHKLQVSIFAPNYRLTPEHPHPAQLDDGLAAYRHLLQAGVDPRNLVVGGDSAGGHLALMLVASLHAAGLSQPAMALALSPWTDIGRRGESQFGNDRYDMVQGYQTLKYGAWLKGDTGLDDEALSPMHQEYDKSCPIYIQAGGKEILVDMIRDFARTLAQQSARVRLDVWEHMTHEFHAYGDTLPQSRQALAALRAALVWTMTRDARAFPVTEHTEVEQLGAPSGCPVGVGMR